MPILNCDMVLDSNKREIIEGGSLGFPVLCYKEDLEKQPVPCHWHEEFELIVIIEGSVEFEIELTHLTLYKGDGLFINTGKIHACKCAKGDSGLLKSIVFHPQMIYGDLNSIYYKKYISQLLKEESLDYMVFKKEIKDQKEAIEKILKAHICAESDDFGSEMKVRNDLSEILLTVIANYKTWPQNKSNKRARDLQRSKEMLRYIENHYAEEITLGDLAKSGAVSESECLRCFNVVLGETPIQYVRKYRLQKAQALLIATNQSIIDIGMNCGFHEMSYFSKSFKKIYNETPSKYREKFKESLK